GRAPGSRPGRVAGGAGRGGRPDRRGTRRRGCERAGADREPRLRASVSLTVRTVHEVDELREFATVHATAFGYHWEDEKLDRLVVPFLRRVDCVARFDGGAIIALS